MPRLPFSPLGRIARRLLRRARRTWGLVALTLLAASAATLHVRGDADAISATRQSSAVVVDGDTLRVNGQRIRLIGIDAPELSQTCRDENGRPWLCGREATARLRAVVGLGLVKCTSSSVDRYGRPLAVCSTLSVPDIGEAMVRAGYAVRFMAGRG